MSRLPVAAFVALAIATIAAFFVTQHLKVSTPLLAGLPAPHPAQINPVDGQTCKGVNHRRMFVSFYLLHRSDDVDVYIVDSSGNIVRTLASGVHMRGGTHPRRRGFFWNGRTEDGVVAPDGTYYIKVALIHQGRSVLISNPAGGPEPITVNTVPPRPRVTGISPSLIPQSNRTAATITYTGNEGLAGRVLVFRTDRPGRPELVKSFTSRRGATSVWDGRISGRPAPQGTYLIGLTVTDPACNTGSFPARIPAPAGTTAGAGVTIRYLAAQPPLTAVPAGSRAGIEVYAGGHPYRWRLSRPGARTVLAAGTGTAAALGVPLPAAGSGLYELSVRSGAHRTAVPLIAAGPGPGTARRILVVLPALTWQGLNPVDDNHDGLPNTLSAGAAIQLSRPLVGGLPSGFASAGGLVGYLRRHHRSYELTTDLALAAGAGSALTRYRGVVLAGDERWVPSRLASALRRYVNGGGRLLSLGIDSLRRGVSLTSARAFAPTGPGPADVLGARVAGPVTETRGARLVPGSDSLGLFSGPIRYPAYQPFAGLTPPLTLASEAGVSPSRPAVIAYTLGRGIVIDIGLPGFGASLAQNRGSRQLLARVWGLLSR